MILKMDLFVFLCKSEHWVHGCLNNTDQDELKFGNDEVDSSMFSAFCIVQDFVGHIWYFKPFSLLDTKFIPPSISNKQTNTVTNTVIVFDDYGNFCLEWSYVSNFFAWTVYFETCIDILYDNTQRNIF